MYTERETTFPSLFTFLHTYVAPPSHQFCYLSSQFPYYIYCDVTYQLFSLSLGIQKTQTYTTLVFSKSTLDGLPYDDEQ